MAIVAIASPQGLLGASYHQLGTTILYLTSLFKKMCLEWRQVKLKANT